MDPLAKAVKRKGWVKEEVINDPEGPIYKIDIKGDEEPDPVPSPQANATKAFAMPGEEGGGFGGPEPVENDDDGPLSPDEEESAEEAQWVENARKRFQQDKADGKEPLWDDPYNEPDDAEDEKMWAYYDANPEELDANDFKPEKVEAFKAELRKQNIDPEMTGPAFLAARFGLTTPESYWLARELGKDAEHPVDPRKD